MKLTALFIIFSLIIILAGKALSISNQPLLFLYIYGLLVTVVLLIHFTVSFRKYKDPYLEAQKILQSEQVEKVLNLKPKNYLVSFMVAVKNEEDMIEECIESILAQTYKNTEIIVVNDASTDRTADILNEYAQRGVISVINLKENVGKKKALGVAMQQAKGEIFAFSDSDCVLATDSLSKVVDIFKAFPRVGAVSGHCRALNAKDNIITKAQDTWYEGQFSVRKAFESVYGVVTCVSGPLAVFRKAAIYNLIPAWVNDKFCGKEFRFSTDRTLTGLILGATSIGRKIKKKYSDSPFVKEIDYPVRDWSIVYCKSAKVWTIVPDNLFKFIKQQIRWKKSFLRSVFFIGPFFWKKPFLPALLFYLRVLFVFMGPFVAFRHLIYLPMYGNLLSLFLYIGGISYIGCCFGLAFRRDNPGNRIWFYRPVMNLISTLILSWLIFYAAITIRRMSWHRG